MQITLIHCLWVFLIFKVCSLSQTISNDILPTSNANVTKIIQRGRKIKYRP